MLKNVLLSLWVISYICWLIVNKKKILLGFRGRKTAQIWLSAIRWTHEHPHLQHKKRAPTPPTHLHHTSKVMVYYNNELCITAFTSYSRAYLRLLVLTPSQQSSIKPLPPPFYHKLKPKTIQSSKKT